MSNHSGFEFTTINNRERAVSTDINGLQGQAAKASMDMLRRWVNDRYDDDGGFLWQTGKAFDRGVDASPLQADVFGGLKVRPFTTFCLVSPGSMGVRATTTNFDAAKDSDYMLINDPGVTSSAVLTFTANASGSLRVDVLECEVIEVISSFENRDIYDPLTGLFTAALVTKISSGKLQYRIRVGTGGAGYPGSVSGFLPLAINIHQIGSSSFDDTDFYDVRPLVQDRTYAPVLRSRESVFGAGERFFNGVAKDVPLDAFFIGGTYILPNGGGPAPYSVNRMGDYQLVGRLVPTLPGSATATTLDKTTLPLSTDYFTPGTVSIGGAWFHVVSIQPHGLPRWRRYSQEPQLTGEREPGPNMGLLCIASQAECNPNEAGVTVGGMQLPAAYGLPGITTSGRIVATILQKAQAPITYTKTLTGRANFLSWSTQAAGPSPASVVEVGGGTLAIAMNFGNRGAFAGAIPAYCSGLRFNVNSDFTIQGVAMKNFQVTAWLSAANSAETLGRITENQVRQWPINIAVDTNYEYADVFEFRLPSDLTPNQVGASGILALGDITLNLLLQNSAGAATFVVINSSASITGIFVGY